MSATPLLEAGGSCAGLARIFEALRVIQRAFVAELIGRYRRPALCAFLNMRSDPDVSPNGHDDGGEVLLVFGENVLPGDFA